MSDLYALGENHNDSVQRKKGRLYLLWFFMFFNRIMCTEVLFSNPQKSSLIGHNVLSQPPISKTKSDTPLSVLSEPIKILN